jgi:polysaccharide deacetylase 2 family uncharacterized protein YibQ
MRIMVPSPLQLVRLAVLALLAITGTATAQLRDDLPMRLEARPDDRPVIAIVIDDLGLGRAKFEAVNALPFPVTLAFLPYGENAQAMLDDASPRHETMLHMPMEPTVRLRDAGPSVVMTGSADEVRRGVERNLSMLTGYKGVNNHTGSKLTAERGAMRTVLRTLASQDLYFLDTRTTPRSVSAELANETGAVVLQASRFLDGGLGKLGAAHVRRQLEALEAEAARGGVAIGVGHPYPETLAVLREWAKGAQGRFRLVTTGELAAELRKRGAGV